MQTDLRLVAPRKTTVTDGLNLPPKWRLAVSARPSFWDCTTDARCHSYRRLHAFGEALVLYYLGEYDAARKYLEVIADDLSERRQARDRDDLPLLNWSSERDR